MGLLGEFLVKPARKVVVILGIGRKMKDKSSRLFLVWHRTADFLEIRAIFMMATTMQNSKAIQNTFPAMNRFCPNLAQTRRITYNATTISSHVTGERPDQHPAHRWISTGEREISNQPCAWAAKMVRTFEAAVIPVFLALIRLSNSFAC
jgi:hypothetical protein